MKLDAAAQKNTKEMTISREDMMELTRRMTPDRSHFRRIAGAYLDEEGYIDGTFNTSFLTLKGEEKMRCFEIAKTVPFAKTNEALKGYRVPGMRPGSIWQLLYALRDDELKNDALLLNLYELISEQYPKGHPYAIYVYYGVYDIPGKASDHEYLADSTEVYRYLILTVSETDADQIPELPDTGFLYPALTNRSTDFSHVLLYCGNGERTGAIRDALGI